MSDAQITHRRERALWRRYMSRCARTPDVNARDRAHVLRALEGAATARREWKAAHDALEARRAEAQGMEAQGAAC